MFGTLNAPTQDRFAGTGPDVERLSRDMMDAWLAFAKTGNPASAAFTLRAMLLNTSCPSTRTFSARPRFSNSQA